MYTKEEALSYIQENDVKFIKLFFTDIFGSTKSLSIQPSELERAFETGIPFDASAMNGFLNVTRGDLLLVPDPATLCVLPWRPQTGRVVRFYCSLRHADGTGFEGDVRALLRKQVRELNEQGYEISIGTKCEFYLFRLDEKGNPTLTPQDNAGYCDLAPRDRGENVRREICLTLEQMGVHPESSHHEKGPGQNQVDFRAGDPLTSADNLQTFKTVVRTVADRSGLYASFQPKPLSDKPGSGLHIDVTLVKDGKNIFEDELTEEARAFIAGVLSHIREITFFLNPSGDSYWRLNDYPSLRAIGWGYQNAGELVRIVNTPKTPALATAKLPAYFELRSPDPSCNPYLAIYLILAAGFEGIREKRVLDIPADVQICTKDSGDCDAYGNPKKVLECDDESKVLPGGKWDAHILALGDGKSGDKAVPVSAFISSLLGETVLAAFRADFSSGWSGMHDAVNAEGYYV
ncbi:MAG: glutamine synthetase family protein [Treponema sp.]|nr:glutamine synthetase family protein [Treponema sp.]